MPTAPMVTKAAAARAAVPGQRVSTLPKRPVVRGRRAADRAAPRAPTAALRVAQPAATPKRGVTAMTPRLEAQRQRVQQMEAVRLEPEAQELAARAELAVPTQTPLAQREPAVRLLAAREALAAPTTPRAARLLQHRPALRTRLAALAGAATANGGAGGSATNGGASTSATNGSATAGNGAGTTGAAAADAAEVGQAVLAQAALAALATAGSAMAALQESAEPVAMLTLTPERSMPITQLQADRSRTRRALLRRP